MIRNSDVPQPSYDMLAHSRAAWTATRNYLTRVAQGDLGMSEISSGNLRTGEVILYGYLNSMGLLLISLLGATIVAIYIGTFTVLTKYKRLVIPLLTLTILGISTPSFFAGLLLQQGAIIYFRETGRRLISMAGYAWDYQHVLLPILVLSARPLAYVTRAVNLGFTKVLDEDYIRTAYSKGLSRRVAVGLHAAKNMIVPVLTAIGVSLRFSLSSLPVVEYFFAWPGMGLRLLEAINARQTTLVVSLALVMGLTFLIINLVLDILYRIVDPRLRDINGLH
jgi:peptide/nickel transport system permease protein